MESSSKVKLQPITRVNWEQCIALEPEDYQQKYLPSNLFSLAQAHYENCEAFGIYSEDKMVGFVMICYFSQVPWITRIMVDKEEQGNGYGAKALKETIEYIRKKAGVYEIRTTIAKSNAMAEHLFTSAGFKRKGDIDDKEFMMTLEW